MTIYKMTAKVMRNRFMERPLRFTEEMYVVADSYDQAAKYVQERFEKANDEVIVTLDESKKIMALFDVRDGEEKIIV